MKSSLTIATRRMCGFTLVELLAVIAIVGILIAITIPVISSVRESANRSQCGANLRSIGLAVRNYISDHNGRLPLIVGEEIGGSPNRWTHQLLPYFTESGGAGSSSNTVTARYNKNFQCPSDDVQRNVAEEERARCSYGLNRNLHVNGIVTNTTPKLIANISDPSRTILGGDVWTEINTVVNATSLGAQGATIADYHSTGSNFCFFDGHVAFLSRSVATSDGGKMLAIP